MFILNPSRFASSGGGGGNGLLTGLVSVWDFESDGSDSHGTNDLTPSGSPVYSLGKLGNGADLQSASNQYFSRSGLLEGVNTFSCSVWYKPQNTTQDMCLFHDGDDDSFNHVSFLFQDDIAGGSGRTDCMVFKVLGGGVDYGLESESGAITAGNWHHIVVSAEASSATGMRMWINNTEVADSPTSLSSVSVFSNPNNPQETFFIGKNSSINDLPDAIIDQFCLWIDRALTATDVANLYNSGSGLPYSSFTT